METFKVTLTVIEPVQIQGLYQSESEEDIYSDVLPKLEEHYGSGNVTIDIIEVATDEEKAYLEQAVAEHKKSMN